MSNPDLSSILGSLSSEDFEALKKVASSLLGGKNNKEQENSENASSDNTEGIDLSKVALPDMSKFASLAPILSEITKDDSRTDFLMALKPFLSDERKSKADEAARIVRLVNLLPLLRERGIL